ncbi:MAG: B12-binding domain-containing radical SAM protein [Candidatus Bathyarchaeota archaeon]|nr:B12-binding domain-containing radical SAM protein [Candidatus Bathyarchaeota archaeon]MDH5787545.1 B12-binding domain-containing radical SAM protein [Candidatus Bathyarchaeota archaeon]
MKISLVNASPNTGFDERERRKSIASFPPLGILYLASVLKETGIEVSVLDQPAEGLTMGETVNWVEKEDPDILGFSTFSSSGRTAAAISHEVKEKNPNVIILFGNYYATFNAERIFKKYPSSVDVTVRGEGENTIIELVDCFDNRGNLKEVHGITFKDGEKIVSTPDRPLIKDLDSIPFPDRRLIDAEYHCDIAGANVAPKKFTSIVSSRGCVYKCRFCSCTRFARNMWRPRSVENVLEELCFLAGEGYEQFIFTDDSFTLNQKRVIKLCRAIKKEKIDMDWICEGRVDNCSYEMLREIAKAGCKVLYFGIESANQRILDYYNKQTTPQQSEAAVKSARKAQIDIVVGSFIVGAPNETREEIQNTIDFARRISIDIPQFNILGVYPGTDLWNEFEVAGLLDGGEYWETGIAVSEICPTAVPLAEIKRMIHDAFYGFVRRPSFILGQVARTLKSSYRMRVLMDNLSQIGEIREGIRAVA